MVIDNSNKQKVEEGLYMSLIKIEHLMKVYGKEESAVKAVNDVSLEIESGDFVAIMGPSGCGKSTLLHLIGGVDQVTSGKIMIKDTDLSKLSDDQLTLFRREEIGIVYQFYNLLPMLNAKDNILLPLKLSHKPIDEDRLQNVIATLQLQDRMMHFPSQLSGGQQQRVAFARTLMSDPSLILADEPTGNLDQKSSEEVMHYIREVHQDHTKTIILVTHDEKIAKQADYIIHMEDGKIVNQSNGR